MVMGVRIKIRIGIGDACRSCAHAQLTRATHAAAGPSVSVARGDCSSRDQLRESKGAAEDGGAAGSLWGE